MKKTEYTKDFKDQTVKYVLESGKSGSAVSKELGIWKNTVCKWVREYQEENQNSEAPQSTYEVLPMCRFFISGRYMEKTAM